MALVATASVPPLPNSLKIPDNDPYHGPGFYILCTTLLHALLAGAPSPVSNFASPSIGFVVVRGFAELPTQYLVLEFHATSSLSLMLQLG